MQIQNYYLRKSSKTVLSSDITTLQLLWISEEEFVHYFKKDSKIDYCTKMILKDLCPAGTIIYVMRKEFASKVTMQSLKYFMKLRKDEIQSWINSKLLYQELFNSDVSKTLCRMMSGRADVAEAVLKVLPELSGIEFTYNLEFNRGEVWSLNSFSELTFKRELNEIYPDFQNVVQKIRKTFPLLSIIYISTYNSGTEAEDDLFEYVITKLSKI